MIPRYFFLYLLLLINIQLLAQSEENHLTKVSGGTAIQEKVSYPTATMIKIRKRNIKEELKSTLMNVGYAGWENGELYMDQQTNDYALFLPDKNYDVSNRKEQASASNEQTSTGQWHFFSSEGRPIVY